MVGTSLACRGTSRLLHLIDAQRHLQCHACQKECTNIQIWTDRLIVVFASPEIISSKCHIFKCCRLECQRSVDRQSSNVEKPATTLLTDSLNHHGLQV